MEVGTERKGVAPTGDESLQIVWFGEVQPAREACQNHSQAENVRKRIVMVQAVFPCDVTGKIDRSRDLCVGFSDAQVDDFPRAFPNFG